MSPLARALALACACLPAATPAWPQGSVADLGAALNAVRASGCGGQPGTGPPLREQAALSRAARAIAGGAPLEEAQREAGYKANQSMVLALQGLARPAAVADFVAQRYCARLLQQQFTDLGVHQAGNRLWIVLAAPFTAPSSDDAPAVARQVLALVNAARAQARHCGSRRMAAAPAVQLDATLEAAALGHARDMAHHGYFDHTGRDGSQPGDRATRAGYRWRMVGENIASGQNTPEAAVAGWLRSPGHCANLMRAEYTQMGLAYAVNRQTDQGIFWVQLFGRPR